MRSTADVVVVGGGIIGMAAAFYLARQKVGTVLLLEREKLFGAGSTSKAAGGIRAQFASRVNVEMSMYSEDVFARFEEETGQKALFDRVGYMFLLSDQDDLAAFEDAVRMQKSLGLDVKWLTPAEIPDLAPHVRLDDIERATYCAADGLGDPNEFLAGYERACRQLGVELVADTAVTGMKIEGGSLKAVETSAGTISAAVVVNATGAWAGEFGKLAGVDVKVLPYPRMCVTTGELDFVKPNFPMVVDVKSGLYCHKESKGMLLGWADKTTEPTFDISIQPEYTDNILERALDRIPQLETAEIANQWVGLYETTPDHRAIIGWEPEVKGLLHLTGFSGHGLMHAPAAGSVAAELVAGREPSIDISDLAPDRFAKGKLVEETNII
jgi:sarcosine oxidase subunit beta